MALAFAQLRSAGLIALTGGDAISFLNAQLTSDVAGLTPLATQYSAYCTPKGRVLASFLLWRIGDQLTLQLPEALRESLQQRLSRYVLRAAVKITAATSEYRVFAVWGREARDVVSEFSGSVPDRPHEVVIARDCRLVRLDADRMLVHAPFREAERVRTTLASSGIEQPESAWALLEVEAGIPIVTLETQEKYLPQMLNLDLIGAVSYTKGCYPGQEIVARTRYLGRLKERMYRIHIPATALALPGDALYSPVFGPDQASGAILFAVPAPGGGNEALAVIQTVAAKASGLRWRSPDGPPVQLNALPYPIPE